MAYAHALKYLLILFLLLLFCFSICLGAMLDNAHSLLLVLHAEITHGIAQGTI